jgi:hypothetical protein
MSLTDYERREFVLNMIAGGTAGACAAAVTNSLEAITVQQQTNPNFKVKELLQKEGYALLTRGLAARIYYNGLQSIVLFNLIKYIGKVFNVQIEDD